MQKIISFMLLILIKEKKENWRRLEGESCKAHADCKGYGLLPWQVYQKKN